ncbi:hypothetical protein ZIOFF_039846 [Zingiber officinale]|uniref:C2 domain-containing protein n=2 Tax=Zingiber officinale TaxID=94328 RepID=A0A8J5G9T1_ZINOF|nr:hypothetical protein ZIOFF_039846 [Zingiber officinale]
MKSDMPGAAGTLPSSFVPPMTDFQLKDTNPLLGGGGKAAAFDLVEKMEYLFVRVVKARDLPAMDLTGSLDPYVEVVLGNFKCVTKHFEKNHSPEWNEVFAVPKDQVQGSSLVVELKDKDFVVDDFVGRVALDIVEVPTRAPPESPLAPEWYRLEDAAGRKLERGELMLAVWFGTQADEAFPFATHPDVTPAVDRRIHSVYNRSKVYHAPRLWYLRVNIINAHDVFVSDENRIPEVLCKAKLGSQVFVTKPIKSRSNIFTWNEVFVFVASEPFENDTLFLSVEDRVSPTKDEVLGRVHLPLTSINKRPDDRNVRPKWYDLKKPVFAVDVDQLKADKFASKVQARVSLDGGYHVSAEPVQYAGDFRPSAKQLWKKPVGVLELGVLQAEGLLPTKTRDGKGACDAYCVAKFGHKWVRTRTAVSDLSPRFHEQYNWDVYDHATVLTVAVFDNNQLDDSAGGGNRDSVLGKVRIRLSTLETDRVYSNSYPLLVLQPSGVKKTGEIHLAVRFSITSTLNTLLLYSKPLLPKLHYSHPLPLSQQQQAALRGHAANAVVARLGRMEPPLRREVVTYMLESQMHQWSLRRCTANLQRLSSAFSGVRMLAGWFVDVCRWANPITTLLVHVLYLLAVFFPASVLPTALLYMVFIAAWRYRFRPRKPPHMDAKVSNVEKVNPEELDEELDTYPTARSPEVVHARYFKLRNLATNVQVQAGNVATQGERLHQLLSWRDPRATVMFMAFCLVAAVTLYAIEFRLVALAAGLWVMRHPKLRKKMPSTAANLFRRLPARTDTLL